jgi:beta-lactamase superfamily II metal-dependent hydrolase
VVTNATTGWKPGSYLRQNRIQTLEMLAITNYDEDHVSGANDLFGKVNVRWLWRNKSVDSRTLKSLKSDTGMGPGIERLASEIENTYTGGAGETEPVFQGVNLRTCFYNRYPSFDDENNLSMAVFLQCYGQGIMFTGDLERAGFIELLEDPAFRDALSKTNIYFASHHGRENGCSPEIGVLLTNVFYVVISDKGYQHETQETIPFYSDIAKGGPFGGTTRKVLTTRNDGRILFRFDQGSWGPM